MWILSFTHTHADCTQLAIEPQEKVLVYFLIPIQRATLSPATRFNLPVALSTLNGNASKHTLQ